jgi:predicted PurR-regulated permease PerM
MPHLERSRLQRSTLLVLFALSAYLFWRTLEPVWVPVFLGLVIAVGAYPLHEKLLRKMGGKHPGLPAALVTAAVMLVLLALIAFVVLVVGQRVIEVANGISKRYADRGTAGVLGSNVLALLSRFGLQPESLQARVAELARNVADVLGRQATTIVTGIFSAIFVFIFTALTSYYLLKEGTEGTSWLVQMLPLPDWQVAQVVRDVRDVTRAMLVSTGVMTVYQGVTSGIGYWIFGVDSPLVWAALTGVASILPAVGTALIWVPVSVVLMATGHLGKGIGVAAWGLLVVVFVADYILRPKLVRTRIKMNDLLVFIAIFGGIEAFGILGLVLGPVAVAILLSLIRIYQTEYRPEGPVETPDPTRPEGAKRKQKEAA